MVVRPHQTTPKGEGMKLEDAMDIINGKYDGFRISFERVDGKFLVSDYFPDRDECPIKSEDEAWKLAERFASKTVGRFINIYVVDAEYMPVKGHRDRAIVNR